MNNTFSFAFSRFRCTALGKIDTVSTAISINMMFPALHNETEKNVKVQMQEFLSTQDKAERMVTTVIHKKNITRRDFIKYISSSHNSYPPHLRNCRIAKWLSLATRILYRLVFFFYKGQHAVLLWWGCRHHSNKKSRIPLINQQKGSCTMRKLHRLVSTRPPQRVFSTTSTTKKKTQTTFPKSILVVQWLKKRWTMNLGGQLKQTIDGDTQRIQYKRCCFCIINSTRIRVFGISYSNNQTSARLCANPPCFFFRLCAGQPWKSSSCDIATWY